MARVFEPFSSTTGAGRGLGLSSVLGIVRAHRGVFRVESRAGEETTFRVLLPVGPEVAVVRARSRDAATAAVDRPDRPLPTVPRPDKPVPVLLVEDEEAVARTVRRILEVAGYSVTLASDGHEALAVLRARPGTVRAVVLNLAMPGLGGATPIASCGCSTRCCPCL